MSIIGKWVGVMVLQVGASDPIGVPGDITISIEQEGMQPSGHIRSGTYIDGTITNVKPTEKGVLFEFPMSFAHQEYLAKAYCVLNGDWMYGLVKLGFEMVPGIDYVKIYVKRQGK